MQVHVGHRLGQTEAIRRLETFFDELKRRPVPGGVEISRTRTAWDGNRMAFSFFAGRGSLGTDIAGEIVVTDYLVVFQSELPALVRIVIGEERVRSVIARELDRVLNGEDA